MKRRCSVYILLDPETGLAAYVGQTRCNPHTRLSFHYRNLRKKLKLKQRMSPVQSWLHRLQQKGLRAKIKIIDANGMWDVSEAVWIDRLRKQGIKLFNVNSVVQ